MALVKRFDLAIKNDALNGEMCANYNLKGKEFEAYQDNDSWEIFKKEMEELYPDAFMEYGAGNGGEMKDGENTPPKMASFASSSRMIYLLARNRAYFKFEKKLPTTAGGTANLDGYLNCLDKHIFVEAKCHEPYSHASTVEVGKKYKPLYEYLNDNCSDIDIEWSQPTDESDMKTSFAYNGQAITSFDLKQMISHLCGIATACIKGEYTDKPIEFLYLLYNPLKITDDKEIVDVYYKTCLQCNIIDFKELFSHIIDGLLSRYPIECENVDILEYAKNNFSFKLCDQDEFKKIIFK